MDRALLGLAEAFLQGLAVDFQLAQAADFLRGLMVVSPLDQGAVFQLALAVDCLPGPAVVYPLVQGAENLLAQVVVCPQVPAAAARLAPAQTTTSGIALTRTASKSVTSAGV